MYRWLKITLKTIGIAVALLTIVWIGIAVYVSNNNKAVLNSILIQVNAKISGNVKVEAMQSNLLRSFPSIGVSLKKVSLKDSLWKQHQHQLLNAQDIDVSLNFFSLLIGKVNVRSIGINNAKIYLYTDSNGYSNTSLFSKHHTAPSDDKDENELKIGNINFKNVELIVDNRKKLKRFHFLVDEIKGKINHNLGGWNGKVRFKTLVRSFAFNTNKGSFLQNKTLESNLYAEYNENTEFLTITPGKMWIGSYPFTVGAKISLAKNKPDFTISIQADQIMYRDISLMLAPNISTKLLKFDIDKPISVQGTIADDALNKSTDPYIKVKIKVDKSRVNFPSGQLDDCSFTGTFNNQNQPKQMVGDENSAIRFFQLSGNYFNAPLRIDTLTILNLAQPIATGWLSSKFSLQKLNSGIANQTIYFKKGTADLKLFCSADIENFRLTKPIISGVVAIKNADIIYLPRQMKFTNSSLFFNFNQNNLNITNSRFQLGKSVLNLSGNVANFLNLYYTAPEKINANFALYSPQLNLSELIPLLASRTAYQKSKRPQNSLQLAANQLSEVVNLATINLRLDIQKAIYKRFETDQLGGNITLLKNSIHLSKVQVKHAGGTLSLNGNIKPLGNKNNFAIEAIINKVNVKSFFYGFENFGQQSITSQNLKGFLSAKVNASGSLNNQGYFISKSMFGNVIFNLDKAALTNIAALKKVQKFIFFNRDLTNIDIEKINGRLALKGDKIMIYPMQINSSVINFNIKGIYGFNNGTAIALDIPLRNPKKDENLVDEKAKKEARMKGIVLHLKAIDDGKGGVKIRWNSDHD